MGKNLFTFRDPILRKRGAHNASLFFFIRLHSRSKCFLPYAREAGEPRIGNGTLIYPCTVWLTVSVDELGVATVALGIFLKLEKDAFRAVAVGSVTCGARKVNQAIGELDVKR